MSNYFPHDGEQTEWIEQFKSSVHDRQYRIVSHGDDMLSFESQEWLNDEGQEAISYAHLMHIRKETLVLLYHSAIKNGLIEDPVVAELRRENLAYDMAFENAMMTKHNDR